MNEQETAGDLPIARIVYIEYARRGVSDLSRRPIVFAYNGGPDSSSVWLHIGVLGPRRIVTDDNGQISVMLVNNKYSLLDRADLVGGNRPQQTGRQRHGEGLLGREGGRSIAGTIYKSLS